MYNFKDWLALFTEELHHIDILQGAVLVLGISEVLLARANKILLYPTGIAATTLAIFSLYKAQLYAECMLHLYYIIMSLYGWWYWYGKKNKKPIEVTFTSPQEWLITTGIVFGGSIILFVLLSTLTNSEVPVWDAWISATGWAGMWLLAKRKVENWLLLNVSNAFAIPLLFHKELPLLALLTVFLFIVACKGYFDWIKITKKKIQQHGVADPYEI